MIRQRLAAGLVTATALLTLAACGSDEKSSSTDMPATTASAVSTAQPATGATTDTTSGGSDAGTIRTDAGESATLPGADDTISIPEVPSDASDECKDLYNKFVSAAGGNDGTAKLGDLFGAMKKIVPADLKDDVDVMTAAYTEFQDAVTKAGGDQAKAMSDPEVQKAMQALSDPKVETASDNVDAWFEKTCPDAPEDTAA